VNSKQRSLNHRLQAKSKCTHLHSTNSADSTFSVMSSQARAKENMLHSCTYTRFCSICFYFVSMRECQQVSGFATTIPAPVRKQRFTQKHLMQMQKCITYKAICLLQNINVDKRYAFLVFLQEYFSYFSLLLSLNDN